MQLSLLPTELTTYVTRQVSCVIPDPMVDCGALSRWVSEALERTEYCFTRINGKYFFDGVQAHFNHLHTDQYAMFLYFLSNTIHKGEGPQRLAAAIYALNKALHAIDVFYEVELPKIFAFQHPVGTVLGRAHYEDYFFVYQRCSVGSNLDGTYPNIGSGVVMFGGSSIIGDCTVKENSWLSMGTLVMDQDLPGNSLVFGQSPSLAFKRTPRNVKRDLFLKNGD